MPQEFKITNVDRQKNFIRGAARIVIASMNTPVAVRLADVIYTTSASNTNEVQTLTISGTPTGGTITLSFKGYTTGPIAYNAGVAAVQAALDALSSIGTANTLVAGTALPGGSITITFQNALAATSVPLITASSVGLTGGTTPGIGTYSAKSGYTDLGATKGGVTIVRNNAEETFDVDQIEADILSMPTAWEMSVASAAAQADIDTIQYLWEGGTITVDATTGERTLPMGTPPAYTQRRCVVLFQRQSIDGGVTPGAIRGYVFRITQRAAGDSSIVHNKTGDQVTVPFTWKALADQSVQDYNARFGHIIDQV